METSDRAVRDLIRVIRRHVDQPTLDRIVEELLDEPGNKSFRDMVETFARVIRYEGNS